MLEGVPLPLSLVASKEEFTISAVRFWKVLSKRGTGGTREGPFTLGLLRLLASQSHDEKRNGELANHRLTDDHVSIDTKNRNSGSQTRTRKEKTDTTCAGPVLFIGCNGFLDSRQNRRHAYSTS